VAGSGGKETSKSSFPRAGEPPEKIAGLDAD
jgi:hypothetical protein